MIEFHISRRARDRYHFDDRLFALTGTVVLANFHAARVFAQHINDRRDVGAFPEQAVSPGDINALGLIDEMLHLVVRQYRAQAGEDVLQRALEAATHLTDEVELRENLGDTRAREVKWLLARLVA